jgi:uncharacterized protein YndB with AHSA1/START domain
MRYAAIGIGLMVSGLIGPAAAAVKDATPTGFTIENQVLIQASPAQVWQAMTGQIDRWWPKDHTWWGVAATLTIDPRAGGCFCEITGSQQAQHLQVVFIDPDKTLRMSGGLGPMQGMGLHGIAEWTLQPEGPATRVTWRYRAGGYTPDDLSRFAPVVDRVQAQQLAGLANWLQQPR